MIQTKIKMLEDNLEIYTVQNNKIKIKQLSSFFPKQKYKQFSEGA